jgi:hypothetical protein
MQEQRLPYPRRTKHPYRLYHLDCHFSLIHPTQQTATPTISYQIYSAQAFQFSVLIQTTGALQCYTMKCIYSPYSALIMLLMMQLHPRQNIHKPSNLPKQTVHSHHSLRLHTPILWRHCMHCIRSTVHPSCPAPSLRTARWVGHFTQAMIAHYSLKEHYSPLIHSSMFAHLLEHICSLRGLGCTLTRSNTSPLSLSTNSTKSDSGPSTVNRPYPQVSNAS